MNIVTIKLYDPVGEVGPVATVKPSHLSFEGGRVGYIFNHHPAAEAIWSRLEANIEGALRPASVDRIDKMNVAISAPLPDIERLVARVDFALVGVGA